MPDRPVPPLNPVRADVRTLYTGREFNVPLAKEDFRVWLLRSAGAGRILLDPLVTNVAWQDQASALQGTLDLRAVSRGEDAPVIRAGDQIMLEVGQGGGWRELWRMRLISPRISFDGGTRSYSLADEMASLAISQDDFKYVKGKRKPQGWNIRSVLEDVCVRYGLTLRLKTVVRHRVRNYTKTKYPPLSVINDMLRMERTTSGRRFITRLEGKALVVEPFQRSETMMILGPAMLNAAMEIDRHEEFATVMTGRGSIKQKTGADPKKHKKRKNTKIEVQVSRAGLVGRFGRIHRFIDVKDADSTAEARKIVERHLREVLVPKRSLTFSHPGIPYLRRGQAIEVRIPRTDVNLVCYLTGVSHIVSASDYTSEVTVTFDDPFRAAALEQAKRAREAKEKKEKAKRPKPPKAGAREDAVAA